MHRRNDMSCRSLGSGIDKHGRGLSCWLHNQNCGERGSPDIKIDRSDRYIHSTNHHVPGTIIEVRHFIGSKCACGSKEKNG